jgi:hypothetical protein
MACVWLIRRFIDRAAHVRYVDPDHYTHEPGQLRFDMTSGEYTHVGESCSFETLVREFALRDPAVHAIAEIVHDIDLKDDRYARPEAAGLAHVFAGIASATGDDDERARRAAAVLDDLHAYFTTRSRPAKRHKPA